MKLLLYYNNLIQLGGYFMSGVTRISVFIIFLALLVIFTGAVAAVDWNVSAGKLVDEILRETRKAKKA